jgi:hypothetical protein
MVRPLVTASRSCSRPLAAVPAAVAPWGLAPGEVAADDGVAAGVAALPDLPEQLGAVAAALGRALVQVGLERAGLAGAGSLPAAVGELLPGGGAGVAPDGVQSPAQVAGDLP